MSMAMIVPHHPTASSIQLWVGQYEIPRLVLPGTPRPESGALRTNLTLAIYGEGGRFDYEMPLPDDRWDRLGPTPHTGLPDLIGIFMQVHNVSGLTPSSEYQVSLLANVQRNGQPFRETIAVARFETLPDRLPAITANVDGGERPFTILLGSCYWLHADNGSAALRGQVAERYTRLYSDPVERPHLKLLVGDQVYLDQPWWEFEHRKSPWELMDFITLRYRQGWDRLKGMLSSGANICITDDHEYWNDYPNTPVFAVWPTLSAPSYRKRMRNIATEFVAKVQLARAVESFTIGNPPQLSVFIADTRMHRSRGDARFMWPSHLDKLVAWLKELKSPGVLALGQPLFTPPESRWSELFGTDVEVSDRNLPGFDQFPKLVEALQSAPHDVCVLSGDVHFGRIARVPLDGLDEANPRTLFEVIASPMAQLPGAHGAFDPRESEGPRTFPATAPEGESTTVYLGPFEIEVPNVPLPLISWVRTVPTKPDDAGRTEEHFMTLAFTDAGNGNVHVQVSAWLIRRPPRADGLPHLAWREEFTLRRKGGLDIAGARSLLLEQEDIPGAQSLLLEQEDIPGARSSLLEQEDIAGARSLLTDNETEE